MCGTTNLFRFEIKLKIGNRNIYIWIYTLLHWIKCKKCADLHTSQTHHSHKQKKYHIYINKNSIIWQRTEEIKMDQCMQIFVRETKIKWIGLDFEIWIIEWSFFIPYVPLKLVPICQARGIRWIQFRMCVDKCILFIINFFSFVFPLNIYFYRNEKSSLYSWWLFFFFGLICFRLIIKVFVFFVYRTQFSIWMCHFWNVAKKKNEFGVFFSRSVYTVKNVNQMIWVGEGEMVGDRCENGRAWFLKISIKPRKCWTQQEKIIYRNE